MFDDIFRARFEPRVRPLAARLAAAGVTPNVVTVSTFAVALAAACLVVSVHPLAGVGVWLLSRVGDGLDGVVARTSGTASAFGGFLDITLDMTAYSAMVLAFSVAHPSYGLAWSAVLAGYVIVITTTLALSGAATAMTRSISGTNRTFQFTRGLAEAGETTAIYIVWALWPGGLGWTIWLWVLVLLATSVQRLMLAREALAASSD